MNGLQVADITVKDAGLTKSGKMGKIWGGTKETTFFDRTDGFRSLNKGDQVRVEYSVENWGDSPAKIVSKIMPLRGQNDTPARIKHDGVSDEAVLRLASNFGASLIASGGSPGDIKVWVNAALEAAREAGKQPQAPYEEEPPIPSPEDYGMSDRPPF